MHKLKTQLDILLRHELLFCRGLNEKLTPMGCWNLLSGFGERNMPRKRIFLGLHSHHTRRGQIRRSNASNQITNLMTRMDNRSRSQCR